MRGSQRLADAHDRVAKAERAHIAATAAAAKARDFAAAIEAEVAAHVERDQALASKRAEDLKKSLRSGTAPKLVASATTTEKRLQRLEAEDRRDAAKRAAEDLAAEERDATAALDDARANRDLAVRSAIVQEVEIRHVSRVIDLERELVGHRIAITGLERSGVAGWNPKQMLSRDALRMIEENRSTSIGIKNAPEHTAADEAAERFRARQAELMKPPKAAPAEASVG